jgi:hypothetical protein
MNDFITEALAFEVAFVDVNEQSYWITVLLCGHCWRKTIDERKIHDLSGIEEDYIKEYEAKGYRLGRCNHCDRFNIDGDMERYLETHQFSETLDFSDWGPEDFA